MKVITEGHKYELENFENNDGVGQVIQFIKKAPIPDSNDLFTCHDGTTNEEILKMLINRMEYLYNKFPSEETQFSINNLKAALYAQQSRTYERTQRGVEGKHLK